MQTPVSTNKLPAPVRLPFWVVIRLGHFRRVSLQFSSNAVPTTLNVAFQTWCAIVTAFNSVLVAFNSVLAALNSTPTAQASNGTEGPFGKIEGPSAKIEGLVI